MNEINTFLVNIYNNIKSKNVLEPPTKAEILDKLSTMNVDNPGIDNTETVDKIADSLTKSIKDYENYFIKNGKSTSIKFLNAINGGYHLLNVFFSDDIIPGTMDSIEIYIPVLNSIILKAVPYVYKFLLDNRISFSSKVSNYNRNDNFIVYVYNKKDAELLINFCNNNLKGNLGILNPFIYKIGFVGVSKQLNGISYNVGIASLINEYIEECILNQRKKSYDAIDFQNFVNDKYQESDNYIEKSMNYIAAMSLYSILTNKNIINYFEDEIELKFDHEYFNYFEEIKNSKISYKHENVVIDEDTNFKVYLKLQALNCLNKIHVEEYSIPYDKVKKINKKFTYKILEQLDYMLDKKGNYNIKVSYKNEDIYNYIPYLYGYMAYSYKSCNVDETKKLVKNIKETIIVRKQDEEKVYYEQNSQKIMSTIPIINTLNGAVAIDIIDKDNLMCNIVTLKRKEKSSFLNVYIDADINLLRDDKSYISKRYRYAVAQALLNKKRCEEALERRKKDFSALFLDTKIDISNYL